MWGNEEPVTIELAFKGATQDMAPSIVKALVDTGVVKYPEPSDQPPLPLPNNQGELSTKLIFNGGLSDPESYVKGAMAVICSTQNLPIRSNMTYHYAENGSCKLVIEPPFN